MIFNEALPRNISSVNLQKQKQEIIHLILKLLLTNFCKSFEKPSTNDLTFLLHNCSLKLITLSVSPIAVNQFNQEQKLCGIKYPTNELILFNPGSG